MQCTRCIAQQGQNLEEEKDHLVKAIVGNAYPHSLIHSASVARPPREDDGESEEETPPTDLLSYEGCKDFNIRAVFTPRPTLSSLHTKVKDPYPLPMEKGASVIYKVPCTCGWKGVDQQDYYVNSEHV